MRSSIQPPYWRSAKASWSQGSHEVFIFVNGAEEVAVALLLSWIVSSGMATTMTYWQ